jgi:hypothetical protein
LNKTLLAIIAGLSMTAESGLTQDNNFGGYIPPYLESSIQASALEDTIYDNYNLIEHTISEGSTFREQDLDFLTSNEEQDIYGNKFDAIGFTRRNPLSNGDRVTVIETTTPEGIHYPYYINIDYVDPEKQDLEIIGLMVPPEEDRSFRFTVEYFRTDGNKYMTMWNNKERHGFFQVEGPYPEQFDFILGDMDDYRLTSGYGPRDLTVGSGTGGQTLGFHRGADYVLKGDFEDLIQDENNFRIPIRAPYDGLVSFGYRQRENTVDDTILDELNVGRYLVLQSEGYVPVMHEDRVVRNTHMEDIIYHCSEFPIELVEQALPDYATDWWWKRILSEERDEEWIVSNIRRNYEEGRLKTTGIQTNFIPVKQGDIIGYISLVGDLTGNGTGLRTGDHAHWEKWLNWQSVDPEIFMQNNGRQYHEEDFLDEKRLIDGIIDYHTQ